MDSRTDKGIHRMGSPYVAVASDQPGFVLAVRQVLAGHYLVETETDGNRALARLRARPPVVAVVDSRLPPRGGGDLIRRLLDHPATRDLPVIVVYDPDDGGLSATDLGVPHYEYIRRPIDGPRMLRRVGMMVDRVVEARWRYLPPTQRTVLRETLSIFRDFSGLVREGHPLPMARIDASSRSIVDVVRHQDLAGLLGGIRLHDDYTYVHSFRVAIYLTLLGLGLGLGRDDLAVLAAGGLVHDIGKAMVPAGILNKPGALTPQEFALVKSHVAHSQAILEATPRVHHGVVTIALQHHEKLDGGGYPRGLKGAEINDLARMGAIADVFSALTDTRPYKHSLSAEESFHIMRDLEGHLDLHLLEQFRDVLLDTEKSE